MAGFNNVGVTSNTATNQVSATSRGTRIVKPGSEMDKNSFLRILSAELTNQDPTNAKDSTQYVSQMAQFAAMEQMTNLNSTMTGYASNALIGKGVTLTSTDDTGTPYSGIVKYVTNNSGLIKLGIEVYNSGKKEHKEFAYSSVNSVQDVSNTTQDNLVANSTLLTAANLIGKKAEFDIKDVNNNNITGLVKGLVIENGSIKLNLEQDGSNELTKVTIDKLIKLDMA